MSKNLSNLLCFSPDDDEDEEDRNFYCDKIVERLSHSCEAPMKGGFSARCMDRTHFNVLQRADCLEIADFLKMRSFELEKSDDACLVINGLRLVGNAAFQKRLQVCTAMNCDSGEQGFFRNYATHVAPQAEMI